MSLPPLFIWLDICVRLCHNWCMTWKRCVHTTHSFMESSLNIMWLDIPVPCNSINSFFLYLLQQIDTCYWNSRHVQFCISCHGIYWNEVSVAFDKSHSCYWTAFQCSEFILIPYYYPTSFFLWDWNSVHLAADNNILFHRLQRGRFVIVKWETNIFCDKIIFNTKYLHIKYKNNSWYV